VDVVQNLTTIAQENASGTEETSSSAAEVGAVMNTIAENAQELNNIAREMEASVKRFIIE
jgi:methyl-accepting chemotaxis protein